MMMPVVPSTTASTCPPTGGAMTGVPHAIACSEVVPDGSYWQVLLTRAAEGRSGGLAAFSAAPANITPSVVARVARNLAGLLVLSLFVRAASARPPATRRSRPGTLLRA